MAGISKNRITKLAVALACFCALSTAARAAIDPSQNVVLITDRMNGDYLNHLEAPPDDPTLNERVFNKGMTAELKTRYAAIYDAYESNKNYNVGGLENEMRYNDANKDLGSWTMHRMLDEQIRTPMRRYAWNEMKDTLRHHDDDKPTGASGASGDESVAAGAAATGASGASGAQAQAQAKPSSSLSLKDMYGTVEHFYNNGLWLNKETLMKFQYDMPGGTMNLALKGGLVDTSFDYYVIPLNLNSGGLSGNQANPERAAFSLNRGFGSLGMSTNMHYGLMSRSLNYGVNKTLIGPLSAGVNQANYLANSSQNETTYRLSLGLRF